MNQSTIIIDVALDQNKIPEQISWSATGSTAEQAQKAKAVMVSFWDGNDKAALRLDLWTKDMMVDEMTDFFYQTMMTMADTYSRATHREELVGEMKSFAKQFYKKSKELQEKENVK
jgi:gliding motility-associated protein GldC